VELSESVQARQSRVMDKTQTPLRYSGVPRAGGKIGITLMFGPLPH
jgi:hypothetical protein